MRTDHFEYLTSIDTKTERYTLVHRSGEPWFAQMETKMVDGSWHCAWMSEAYLNQAGARQAITEAFGL